MNKNNIHIDWRILRESVVGQLSVEQKKQLDSWLSASSENQKYYEKAIRFYKEQEKSDVQNELDYQSAFDSFLKQTNLEKKNKLRFIKVAASMALIIASGWIGLTVLTGVPDYQTISDAKLINAKEGKVELILSSGKKVFFEKEGEVSILEKDGEIKKKQGVVDYSAFSKMKDELTQLNTVKIPRGTDFKLVLSDSTVVWLNAESSITYPVKFSGDSRKVAISGEVYFDVTHDKSKPFVVETEATKVKVLGTKFNIKAYQGDEAIYTTLLEGQVLVENSFGRKVIIKPDEQAITGTSAEIEVREVDASREIDWMMGLFEFEDEKLGDILDELARWYDLKIFFESEDLKGYEFTGTLRKYNDLNQLLQLLEMTRSVKFYVKDDVVLVKKVHQMSNK